MGKDERKRELARQKDLKKKYDAAVKKQNADCKAAVKKMHAADKEKQKLKKGSAGPIAKAIKGATKKLTDIEYVLFDEINKQLAIDKMALIDQSVDLQLRNIIDEINEIDTMFRILRKMGYKRMAIEGDKAEAVRAVKALAA